MSRFCGDQTSAPSIGLSFSSTTMPWTVLRLNIRNRFGTGSRFHSFAVEGKLPYIVGAQPQEEILKRFIFFDVNQERPVVVRMAIYRSPVELDSVAVRQDCGGSTRFGDRRLAGSCRANPSLAPRARPA